MSLKGRRPLRSRSKLRAKNPDRRQYDPEEFEAYWQGLREWEEEGLDPIKRKTLSEIYWGTEEFQRFCHNQLCQIDGCYERDVEMAHAKSRAAGGTWRDIYLPCREHHREQHQLGILTFEAKYGIDCRVLAAEVQRRWRELNGDES